MHLYESSTLEKQGALSFLDQLKLQAFRRYEDENRRYGATLDDHVLALEAVVANASDGIALVEGGSRAGLELRIQYVNTAFSKLSGYSAREILGKSLRVLFGTDINAIFEETVEKAFVISERGEIQAKCVRRDHTTFDATIKFTPVVDGRGRTGKWFFEIRDSTEQFKSAQELARLRPLEAENDRLKAELSNTSALEARLLRSVLHDPVTGLKNRSYFVERVEEVLNDAEIGGSYAGAILYVGFGNFETLIKEIGHRAEEHMLIEISRRLKIGTDDRCTIAHLDGAEFAILLNGPDLMCDTETSNKLVEVLAKTMDILDRPVNLQPAMGLCAIDPLYKNAEHIVRHADTAMYRSARQGGMRCTWFEDAANFRTAAWVRAKREMEEAIDNEEFVVSYQPQLDVLTSPPRLCSVEALVRWNHRSQGVLMPDRFLSLAEKYGLAVPLGLFVLRSACFQLKKWQASVLLPDISLTVNISTQMLEDPEFFSKLVDILVETEIDAHVLHLDIPECVFVTNDKNVLDMLQRIRTLGVRIVVDNWGKSNPSVLMLDNYPVDAVKLDRSLVSSLERSKAKLELAKMLISYAKALEILPSATGVSTAFERSTLPTLGCTVLQGHAFSEAVSAEAVTALLDGGTRSLMQA